MQLAGLVLAASLATAGCVQYQPGSFHSPRVEFAAERRTIGCLDVALSLEYDARVRGPVLGYALGNRCDRAVAVDLAAVRVRGVTTEGRVVSLPPYDPGAELRPLWLEVRSATREVIEYVPPDGAAVARVCVDASAVDGGVIRGAVREACFERGGGG